MVNVYAKKQLSRNKFKILLVKIISFVCKYAMNTLFYQLRLIFNGVSFHNSIIQQINVKLRKKKV